MARLLYSAITSLDGYVADQAGTFDWSMPDDEVHACINDLIRPVATHLYGRRMYDVLAVWETIDSGPTEPEVIRDFATLWRAADKVVYSTTLETPRSARTRIERAFDADEIRRMKEATDHDLTIGGPTIAARAFEARLIDDVHLFINPIVVGGGLRALPPARVDLELLGNRRFANGVVHLHYRTTGGARDHERPFGVAPRAPRRLRLDQ
jgi:dihydrofolate reductase